MCTSAWKAGPLPGTGWATTLSAYDVPVQTIIRCIPSIRLCKVKRAQSLLLVLADAMTAIPATASAAAAAATALAALLAAAVSHRQGDGHC